MQSESDRPSADDLIAQEEPQQWVRDVMSLYREFNANKSTLVHRLYDDEVVFSDPIHRISGISALEQYFSHIGQGLNYCEFTFSDTCATSDCAWLKWQMTFSHPRLGSGKRIEVLGATELRRTEKIYSHTDFYDMGAMLYEHVPVLGFAAKKLKQRLGAR